VVGPGKQVCDVVRFIECFINNLGGGRDNSCSILEVSGTKMVWVYIDRNREGDHICYISNLSEMKAHYPNWNISKSLNDALSRKFLEPDWRRTAS